MIEQDIEQKIESKLSDVVDDSIQILSTWGGRGIEENGKVGYLTISVQPRRYSTPTVPTSEVPCILSLNMRSEVDDEKTKYVETTEKLMEIIQAWQDDISVVSDYFTFDGFDCTGFQITDGNAGLDVENKTWTYTISFSLFGVVD